MNTGRFRPISLSQIVSSAKLQLRLYNTTEWDNYLEMLADEGLKHLLTNDQDIISSCVKEIRDGRACLPNGFKRLIAVILTDENGNELALDWADQTLLVNSGLYSVNGVDNRWNRISPIQGGHIVFDFPLIGDAQYCKIVYMGRNLDEYGLTVAHEMEERAIVSYIAYKFARAYPKQYTAMQIRDWKDEWQNQKRFLQGEAVQRDFQDNKDRIAALFNSFLVFKTFGQS